MLPGAVPAGNAVDGFPALPETNVVAFPTWVTAGDPWSVAEAAGNALTNAAPVPAEAAKTTMRMICRALERNFDSVSIDSSRGGVGYARVGSIRHDLSGNPVGFVL